MGSLDDGSFIVWDPITGDQVELSEPGIPCHYFSASVLCSRRGCDHLHCAGDPFLVIFVGSDYTNEVQRACVYSSEAGAWSAPASLHVSPFSHVRAEPWCACWGQNLLYTYARNGVLGSVISLLGLAGIQDSKLYTWSKKVEPEEVAGWVQWENINLETLVPTSNPSSQAGVIDFAEAVGAIFIRINACVYIIELKSGKMRKVCKDADYYTVLPLMSFYTPAAERPLQDQNEV